MAWISPIAVPNIDWGGTIGNPIDLATPSMPSPWTSDQVGYYYVKSGGTNAGYGYPANPRATIPTGAVAGSIIFVEGTYTTSHSSSTLNFQGTNTAPVWVIGVDPDNASVMNAGLGFHANCTHAIFENMRFFQNGGVEFASGVDHLCFRNGSQQGTGTVDGTASTGSSGFLFLDSTAFGQTEQIVFYNMNVSFNGMWMYASGDPDHHGIRVGKYHQDFWIVDSEFSYMSGNGVQLVTGTSFASDEVIPRRCYIARNIGHHIAQSGFWSKRSQDCVFSQNVVHSIRRDTPSSADAAGIGCQYGTRNLLIIANTVYNCQGGIAIASDSLESGSTTTPVKIIGNLLYDIHDTIGSTSDWNNTSELGGVAMALWGSGAVVVNNTMDDVDAGIYTRGNYNYKFDGNIVTDRNQSVAGWDFNSEYAPTSIASNIFEGAEARVATSNYTSIAAINGLTGASGNTTTAPTYTDAANRNYTFADDTSAGYNGFGTTPHAAYTDYETLYSRNIEFDHDGGVRPAFTSWDIGAFEYGSADIPANTVAPYITGTAQINQTLTANPGTWTWSPTFTYQWIRCDAAGANPVDISGATSSTYAQVIADVGGTIRVEVTGTNGTGSDSATSAATGVVQGLPVPTFSVSRHITPNSP